VTTTRTCCRGGLFFYVFPFKNTHSNCTTWLDSEIYII
jgi:hypothetical protein